jgi:hypothetical protein
LGSSAILGRLRSSTVLGCLGSLEAITLRSTVGLKCIVLCASLRHRCTGCVLRNIRLNGTWVTCRIHTNDEGFSLINLKSCKGRPWLHQSQIPPSSVIIAHVDSVRLPECGTQWRNPSRNSRTLANRNLEKSYRTTAHQSPTAHQTTIGSFE